MQAAVVCVLLCMVLGMVQADPSSWTMMAPQPCCAPKQMEFILGESVASATKRKPSLAQLSAQVAVDYTSKQMAVHEVGEFDGELFNVTAIANYTSQEAWVIDGHKNKCHKIKLPSSEMRGQCLPKEAKYVGTVTFGLGTTVSGDSWVMSMRDEKSGGEAEAFVIVSSDTCVPLVESYKSKSRDAEVFAGMSYFNIKDKIRDRSVFNVPAICRKDVVQIVEYFETSPLVDYMIRKQQMK